MGTTCSSHASNNKCNCFVNDTRIKNINIIRYSTKDWIWSNNHDTALIQSLSSFSDAIAIPNEIMYVIKDHSFHHQQKYKIICPVIQCEKYYSKQNHLLQKKLCQNWYKSQTNFASEPVPIALHVSNSKQSEAIFDIISDTTLPSLQLDSNISNNGKREEIMRTIHIDECKIRLHLISINNNNNNNKNNNYAEIKPIINMILLNEDDSLTFVNQTCKMLWNERNCMTNCMIVKMRNLMQNKSCTRNNCKTIDELAKCYNIPCISICLENENTINKLFNFAIKYYWFCNVV